MKSAIRITEVGPRDGLQNEKATISLEAKVAFINALSATGVQEIEAGAFVSPKAIPQLADSEEVFSRIERKPGVIYSALVPNEKGMERAIFGRADKIAVFTAASETFNQKNINAGIKESIERFEPVIRQAKAMKMPVRGYVSAAFHCPYEGPVAPQKVLGVALELLALGADEVSLGDTIGRANPDETRRLLDLVLKEIPKKKIVLHFHDTYGMAIANALAAYQEYQMVGFDSSAGGLGGCPYAQGAAGNVATEDLLYALSSLGAKIPASIEAVAGAAGALIPFLGHALYSRAAGRAKGQTFPS
ncbi:MAG: hydroxymethylglutaryl-CoA lyase [Elusimicrobia bacterium]|nr:hydroxymethylglutaryl-CoA lyase [Elusimicrobiota bacterium]